MKPITVDASSWDLRDCWTTADGELCVRPGLRQVYAPPIGCVIVGACSVRNDFALEVLHYVVVYDGAGHVRYLILDENFDTFCDFRLSADVIPRIVTFVVVGGQILICSPDLPTVWGLVGSGLIVAQAVQPSPADGTTAIDVPRGIGCVFSNRAAIADGRVIYISDPVAFDGGDLRTFVPEDINGRDGVIYGLHQGAGGALVAVTTQGTHALSTDAAAVAIVQSNGTPWQLLSHASAYDFRSSCEHLGRVYTLTERGYIAADVEGGDETAISDSVMPRLFGARAHLPDYRRCRMVDSDAGPIIASRDLGLVHRSDFLHGLFSWWSIVDDVVGTLHDVDATEMIVTATGAYRVAGDFDGATALTSETAIPAGVLAGKVETPPMFNSTVRRVHVAAACDGANRIDIALRGVAEGAVPRADTLGLVVGSSSWGDARIWQPTPVAGMSAHFGDKDSIASRDVSLEVRAQGGGSRVSSVVNVEMSEGDNDRPQNEGTR